MSALHDGSAQLRQPAARLHGYAQLPPPQALLHHSAQLPPPPARLHDYALPAPPPPARPHGWGLLKSTTTIKDLPNETTAWTLTRANLTIQVSFVLAEPPRLSYFCVYCLNGKAIAFASEPTVVSSMEDTALIRVVFTTQESPQYFLYRARGPNGGPSLHLLPDFRQYSQTELLFNPPIGFVSLDNHKQFVMAALSFGAGRDGQYYNLHTIGSELHSTWSKKLLKVEIPDGLTKKSAVIAPNKVIDLGGGFLGWVDVRKGIVICDVLNPDATKASFVPMPKLLPNNNELYGDQLCCARQVRDVTFSSGYIKCVEIEELLKLRPTTVPAVPDPWDRPLLHDSELAITLPQEEVYDPVGWRLITWYRALGWNGWCRGNMVHSDDLGTVSLPLLGGALNVSFKNLRTASPSLRGDDDVVYLMSTLQEDNQAAWIVPVDTKWKSVGEVMLFPAERSSIYRPTFIPCVLSKYLNAKSSGEALAGKRIVSRVPPSRNLNQSNKQPQAKLEEHQRGVQLPHHSSGEALAGKRIVSRVPPSRNLNQPPQAKLEEHQRGVQLPHHSSGESLAGKRIVSRVPPSRNLNQSPQAKLEEHQRGVQLPHHSSAPVLFPVSSAQYV